METKYLILMVALLFGAVCAEADEPEDRDEEPEEDEIEPRGFGSSHYYNYYDEIATSVCASLPDSRGFRFAVRRKCGETATCQQICTGSTVASQLTWKWTQSLTFDCIESLHVYKNRPALKPNTAANTDIHKIGLLVWRYHSCASAGCGPNYCCCQKK